MRAVRLSILMVSMFAIVAPAVRAADCTDRLATLLSPQSESISATAVSLNANGLASYASFPIITKNVSRAAVAAGGGKPSTLSGRGNQVFSDRQRGAQGFAADKADDLKIDITRAGAQVMVTFTLLSWGNGRISFTPSCDGQIMHGCTADAQACYLVQVVAHGPIL